jgi:hypothetical protein
VNPSLLGSGDPHLDQYQRDGIITPTLQRAMEIFKQKNIQQIADPSQPGGIAKDLPDVPRGTPPAALGSGPAAPAQAQSGLVAPPQTNAAQPSVHQAELNRLTAPPIQNGPQAHTSADTGRSGIGQIHNPWLRVPLEALQAIGTGFAPRLTSAIPGTDLHHNLLVNAERNNVNQEQKTATEEAQRGEIPGEEALRAAQTGEATARGAEANARANSLTNPPDKEGDMTVKAGEGVWDKKNHKWEVEPTSEEQTTEISPDVGKSLGIVPTKDGKYLLPKGGASLLKPDKEEKTPQFSAKEAAEIRAVGGDPDKPETITADVLKKANALHEKQTGEPGSWSLQYDKDNKPVIFNNKTAEVRNSPITKGPTTQQRNVGAQAQLVHEQIPGLISEIDRLKDKLGPVSGRWNEFMQGKVGLNDPDFAGLRTDLLMASSAVALMHARGRLPENLRAEFDNAINAPQQNFENLKSVLKHVDQWTAANMKAMGAPESGGSSGGVRKYNPATGKLE